MLFTLFASISSYAQNLSRIIFFHTPYTIDIKTNQYQTPTTKFDYNTQYNNLKNANVKGELVNALKHHDYTFIAISGNSYLYPGLEGGYKYINGAKNFISIGEKYDRYVKKYKSKAITGTSDAIESNKPDLQGVAYTFAKSYNKLLLLKLQEMEKHRSK